MPASFVLFTALVLTGPQPPRQSAAPAAAATSVRVPSCRITLIEEVAVPAQEAGVLVQMEAKEMMQYDQDTVMGRIDDSLQKAQRNERKYEYEAAQELAENNIEERYAIAATNVAAAEHDKALDANKRAPNAITQVEIQRLQLTWHRSELQIEKARHERKMNKLTAEAKNARLAEIEAMIDHRQVKAPITGMVVDVVKHPGEWVQAGETILKMVRLNRLRVKGYLKASDYTVSDVVGKPVTVEVTLARGKKVEVPGTIKFVSPQVEGDEFAVWAEIANKQDGEHWLLSSGLSCDMTIHTGGLASQPASARPLEPMRR